MNFALLVFTTEDIEQIPMPGTAFKEPSHTEVSKFQSTRQIKNVLRRKQLIKDYLPNLLHIHREFSKDCILMFERKHGILKNHLCKKTGC